MQRVLGGGLHSGSSSASGLSSGTGATGSASGNRGGKSIKRRMFDFVLKGATASQLEKDIGSDLFPANEHYFGLVNVSRKT